MNNHDLLYAWWWSNAGPRIAELMSIQQIENNLIPARNNLIVMGLDGNRLGNAGWNYAVLKFLLQYCDLPDNVRNIFQGNGNYGVWRQHLVVEVNVRSLENNPNPVVAILPLVNELEEQNVDGIEIGGTVDNQAPVNIVWEMFYSFSDAVEYSGNRQTVYMQTSNTGDILRIGKASKGLGNRYNGGYQRTLDAAMWESGNKIYITKISKISVHEVEANLINSIRPILNRQIPATNPNLIINHDNIVIENSRVVSYLNPMPEDIDIGRVAESETVADERSQAGMQEEDNEMDINNNLTLWDQIFVGGRVPTGHNFSNVISLYSDFRMNHPGNTNVPDFRDWLVIHHGQPLNTANANCYPLGNNQMTISQLSDAEVQMLANQPLGVDAQTFLARWRRCDVNVALPTCLADVYIAGHVANLGLVGQAATNLIVAYGLAGVPGSANTLLAVGRSMGKHFGFLTEQNQPTAFFNQYFS